MSFFESEKNLPRSLAFTSQIYIMYPISKPVSGKGYRSRVIDFGYSRFVALQPSSQGKTKVGSCYPAGEWTGRAATSACHPSQASSSAWARIFSAAWRTSFCESFFSHLYFSSVFSLFKLSERRVSMCCFISFPPVYSLNLL